MDLRVSFLFALISCPLIAADNHTPNFEKRYKQLAEILSSDSEPLFSWKDNSASKPQVEKFSKPKYDPKWFTALSKIARIRTADGRSWDAYEESGGNHVVGKEDPEKQKIGSGGSVHFRPKKFHCRPIRDVFVPKMKKNLPAYACKLGSRTFVLTSERFLQDRRAHVDVSVDDSTFLRLNSGPLQSPLAEVIPATLVLNRERNDYGIRRT